jgi:transposase-like protein
MTHPPFCPYPECQNHEHPPRKRWWRRAGFHATKCFGDVPRFQCRSCFRTFSTQTFSTDYYAKKQIDYRVLERQLASSMSVRSLARSFDCSCGSILNRVDRLSRQAIAAHARLRALATNYEDVCIDGLVSFDRSQYFPNNITLSITAESRYVLSFTHATLRRSGTMRPGQKKRRDSLYQGLEFEARALERSFGELLDELKRDRPPREHKPLVVITDEKKEYARAFAAHSLFREQDEEHRVVHRRINSRLPRTFLNPLFASNYLDREIRKDQAAHRRETTCFGRNVANGLSRTACYLDWHNYAKRYLIKAPVVEDQSHGEEAGIPRSEIERSRRRMFRKRAFLSLIKLDALEEKIWLKRFPTPGRSQIVYLPAFAFG